MPPFDIVSECNVSVPAHLCVCMPSIYTQYAGQMRLYVVVRDVAGEVTVERQIGYCAKDHGQPHFDVDYLRGITHDVLRARGAAYAQVRGGNVFHSKTELKPYTMWSVVAKFEQGNLYPLNCILNIYQVVRLMLMSKKYMLAPTWCAPYSGRFAVRATHAWVSITRDLRMYDKVDLYDVVSVLTRGEYGAGSESYEYMVGRDERFDDISLDEAKRMSRRAHQILQPHMQHGVVVGDVDIDAAFADLQAPEVAEDVQLEGIDAQDPVHVAPWEGDEGEAADGEIGVDEGAAVGEGSKHSGDGMQGEIGEENAEVM